MTENNNLNNDPYANWELPKNENEEINNNLSSSNNTNMDKNAINSNIINNHTNTTTDNNINNNIASTNTINNNINNNIASTNTINNNINNNNYANNMIYEESKNNIFSETFYALNMKFIVPGLVLFGCFYLIFGALGESRVTYYLVLSFCFGYSILIFILFLIHKIKNINNDIKHNGISILGKTKAEKIKSIFILCVIIFNLIIFLFGKLFAK